MKVMMMQMMIILACASFRDVERAANTKFRPSHGNSHLTAWKKYD